MTRFTKLAIATALPSALLSIVALAQTATTPADANGGQRGHFAHALKRLDTDRDGRISLDEYLAGATARFKAADVKNAGSLTAAQLAASPRAQKHDERVANMLVRRLDAAAKGYVTAEDFAVAAQKRFASIDTQGTGKLTFEQFSAARPGRLEHLAFAVQRTDGGAGAAGTHTGFHEKFAQAAFAQLDANGDGVVTRDEFVAAAKARFSALDASHTGQLTAAQIAKSPTAQQRDLKFADHIVKKLDTNGDGSVSLDEYLAGAKARFSRLDRGGDGYLDAGDGGGHRGGHGKGAQPTS
ncbi:MAG: EF-hand domain-containing protein [Rudaea sp.]